MKKIYLMGAALLLTPFFMNAQENCTPHAQVSNNFENGLFNETGGDQLVANDFIISANTLNFSATSVTANILTMEDIISLDLRFFADEAGGPGAEMVDDAVIGVVPTSQAVIGTAFGYDVREVVVDFAAIDFPGNGATAVTYWMQLSAETATTPTVDGMAVAWETTTLNVVGANLHFASPGTPIVWTNDDDANDGVFSISGECTLAEGCLVPENLTAVVNGSSVDLTWTELGSATEWTVEYGPAGFILGEGMTQTAIGTPTASISGLEAAISYDFYVKAVCTEDESAFAGPVSLFFESYCTVSTNFDVEPITLVEISDMSNSSSVSSTDSHEYFLDISAILNQGVTYPITIEGFTGGDYTTSVAVFIDWDGDHTFNNTDERYEIGILENSTGVDGIQLVGDITVPVDAPIGTTRMRVIKMWTSDGSFTPDACAMIGYGQAEDYMVEVTVSEECTEANAGTPNEVALEVCANNLFTVSVTGATAPGDGLTRIWQSSPAGDNNWMDIAGANSTSYTVAAGIQVATDYRYVVTCTPADLSDESDVIEVTVAPASDCYCTPTLDCTDGDLIANVSFLEINNATTCSPNGYGDFTDMIASTISGNTYPISVTVGDGWDFESVSVWIDFDNSGTFDEDEFFYIGTGSDEVLTGDITIPAEVQTGNYRMRVRVAAVGVTTATWDMSCDETQGYGETEDYTVYIEFFTSVASNDNDFKMGPNPTKDFIQISSTENISSIVVYNIAGQQVINNQINVQSPVVDLSSLQNGMYLMEVTIKDSKEVYKVVKH